MKIDQNWSVEEFMNAWVKGGRPMRPPFKNAIHATEIAYSVCLFREGQYQVEMYIMKPNVETPMHSHPNVSQITVYLTGNCDFSREEGVFNSTAEYQKEKENGTHFLLGKAMETLNNTEHAIRTHKEGGAFLVFEHWHDKEPTSVASEWKGKTVGKEHDQLRERYNELE